VTIAEFEIAVFELTKREKVIFWTTAAEPLNLPLDESKVTAPVEPEATANTPVEQPKLDQELDVNTENSYSYSLLEYEYHPF
jgi:hypothetical protein